MERHIMVVSENIQMYMVKLLLLSESSGEPLVNISSLADSLEVQTVSANQMVHKLDELGLVEYQPYKGVSLTEEGHHQAVNILRHRRLWEVFLVNNLGFDSDTAEELACRIEHVTTDEIDDRLAAFLNHPNLSPMGKIIPGKDTKHDLENAQPLSTLSTGQNAVIVELPDDSTSARYFQDSGLYSGSKIKVLATSENGTVLVETENNKIHLADSLCAEIKIR
jgi:DtxR family Mn-dependent transcriptional regulator